MAPQRTAATYDVHSLKVIDNDDGVRNAGYRVAHSALAALERQACIEPNVFEGLQVDFRYPVLKPRG